MPANSLTSQAIGAALDASWQKAIELNQQILEENPQDIDALNRLAKAHAELGEIQKAISYYQSALKIDPHNPIALKNLGVFSLLKNKKIKTDNHSLPAKAISFIDEPGKTKISPLVNLAQAEILAQVSVGAEVDLLLRERKVCVHLKNGDYLGRLPDDLSHRLLPLIKGGNQYLAFIKSVEEGLVKIFIKEKSRAKRFLNTPSFPSVETEKEGYQAFFSPDLIHESRPEVSYSEEEEETESQAEPEKTEEEPQ